MVKPLGKQKLDNKEYIVSTKELCEILGLSSRRIQQLAKANTLVRHSHGKYDLPGSIQAYIETLKEQHQTNEVMDYNKEKTLLTRANRMKAEMELEIIQGHVHKSEDVESVMNDMLTSFRAQMLVLPGRIAPQLLGVTKLEVIKTEMKEAIYEALQELADYDPDVFYNKDVIKIDDKSEEVSNKNKKGTKKNGRNPTES